jgi:hypothetical protein
MKKLLSYLVVSTSILGLFTLASCEGDGVPFTIPQEIDQTFVVPAGPDSSFTLTSELSTNIDSFLTANDLSRDQISVIVITGAKLGQVDTNGQIVGSVFEFDTISVAIGNVDRPAAFDSVFAYIPGVFSLSLDEGGFILMTLRQTEFDIVPYVTKPKYRITIKGKLSKPSNVDIIYRLKVKMNIGVIAV